MAMGWRDVLDAFHRLPRDEQRLMVKELDLDIYAGLEAWPLGHEEPDDHKRGSKQIGEILVGGCVRKFRIDSFLNHHPVRLDFPVESRVKSTGTISAFF